MNSRTPFNRLRTACLIVAGTLLAAGCAGTGTTGTGGAEARAQAEATPANAQASTSKAAALDPDGMRCKRISETGSRMKKKVCATNREWDASERAAQEAAESYQRGSAVGRGID